MGDNFENKGARVMNPSTYDVGNDKKLVFEINSSYSKILCRRKV